jgi:hypothetical protein
MSTAVIQKIPSGTYGCFSNDTVWRCAFGSLAVNPTSRLSASPSIAAILLHRREPPLKADCVAKVESCMATNFRENTKRKAITDSYDLNRIAEVAGEFSVRR